MKQNKNILKLRKCAYIFDNTSNFFHGTYAQIKEQLKTLAEIKKYYDDEKKRAQWIPYEIKTVYISNGEAFPVISIMINGKPHELNALQIEKIKGEAEVNSVTAIINKRTAINIDDFPKAEPTTNARNFCHSSLLFKDFKSLEVENFTAQDDLGYIRIRFNRNIVKIIVTDSGDFYTAEGVNHNPTNARMILEALEARSLKIQKILLKTLNYFSEQARRGNSERDI